MPAFKKFKKSNNKNSYDLSEYGICLPSGNDMNKKKIIYVTKILKKIINEHS
jgi:dTDP-4-amino-4,6-dideoxygalactose transaminase